MPYIPLPAILLLAYLLGSIPFGLLIAYTAGLGDIRKIGSGNIGATNVMRTGHKGLGALTLLLDGCKGAAAVLLVQFLSANEWAAVAGLLAVLGHIFPVWLRFKGGKGVATSIGVMLALNVIVAAAVIVVWLAAFRFTRISSLASILSVGYAWIVAYMLEDIITAAVCLLLAGLIVYTHRANIRRLLDGTEYRFSESLP